MIVALTTLETVSVLPELTETEPVEWSLAELNSSALPGTNGPCIVILYNDDHHNIVEVIAQVQKATGYAIARCIQIAREAHFLGRSIAYSGSDEDCERVARILREIRLQVETDHA